MAAIAHLCNYDTLIFLLQLLAKMVTSD